MQITDPVSHRMECPLQPADPTANCNSFWYPGVACHRVGGNKLHIDYYEVHFNYFNLIKCKAILRIKRHVEQKNKTQTIIHINILLGRQNRSHSLAIERLLLRLHKLMLHQSILVKQKLNKHG